jgi:hypothetical protein
MARLNQILAVEKNRKTALHGQITDLHHKTQKADLLTGHHKMYTSKEEDGETFPDDVRRVQLVAKEALDQVSECLASLMDVTATKDWANCQAKANVLVGDKTFLAEVPVPYLLFLEKELRDLNTFVEKIVELDPGERWTQDALDGSFRSDPVKTQKSKKLKKPIVLYPATPEHPAQTQLIEEDVVTGTWTTTKFSGAIPRSRKKQLLERIGLLEDAVKFAREQANALEVDEKKVGKTILDFVFAP